MEKENGKKVETVSLSTREQTYYILLIVGYLFIGIFGIFFHQKFAINKYRNLSIFFVIALPLMLITYSTFYHVNFEETHSDEDALNELEREIQTEEAPKTIPVILFGLGILLTNIGNKAQIKNVIPYLVSSLFFGTVMTELLNQLIFNHYDLERMIVISELNFMFTSIAFGLLFMSIILTLTAMQK